jgi:hypothetical protein
MAAQRRACSSEQATEDLDRILVAGGEGPKGSESQLEIGEGQELRREFKRPCQRTAARSTRSGRASAMSSTSSNRVVQREPVKLPRCEFRP